MTKTALITGAASGLGYELSLLLAKDAYNLILIDVDAENLNKVKAEISQAYSCKIDVLVKDLSKPNVAIEIVEDLNDVVIDVLVNNAGFGLFGSFNNTDWDRELDMLYVHIITTTHLTKLLLEGMVQRGSGKILNISSLAAFQPGPLMSIYYASKSYLLSFSEAIANELRDTGVTVTVLCPGPTKTAFQEVVSENATDNKISFNMACPSEVAHYGYKAMQKGKTVAIPGLFNKFLATIHRFVTRKMAVKIIRNIQEMNRE
ncbi:short-chain dehydrogenase [Yeosuana aromativorans]|uniref:Short-chain dehydrogenase n=1 Tax=Yeosuana aromativorans TaxID=288019 RepID=A0A8J3BJJ5_9FLAO|nr:SDR family oxidoreductase [Yeosuana aromativorans]GGK25688.1 short-chain dehydrogenase [Yeosuana aromativorans]